MHEVVTESDLTIFVCPCGSQFGEELNYYFHLRSVHREPVFRVLSEMNGKNPSRPHAFPVDQGLDGYGPPVVYAYLPLLGSETTILSRLRRLFIFKNDLPRVLPKYAKGTPQHNSNKQLPKWQEMRRQLILLKSSSTTNTNEVISQDVHSADDDDDAGDEEVKEHHKRVK